VVGAVLSAALLLPAVGSTAGAATATAERPSAVTATVAAAASTAAPVTTARRADVRRTRALYADPTSAAARAAKRDARFRPLATAPQAKWLLDSHGARVGKVARAYVTAATKAGRTPVVALYAIPARDCGSYSSGGLTPRQYRAWVRRVARPLRGARAIAIVEPDAVAMLGACADQGPRAALLRYAVNRLRAAGTWVYLDGGHSNWIPPATMAARLKRSGVANARGFVTNVANFQPTAAEDAYARAVRAELAALGVRRVRYAIETSRNGARRSGEGVCNPRWARVGLRPRIRLNGARDGFLWVKRPGESDGECGRGDPAAGRWWARAALRLLGR